MLQCLLKLPKMMCQLRLTKQIREDSRLSHIPVVLFSSLITEENRKKGDQVGATLQISKPELLGIANIIDRFIHEGIAAFENKNAA